MTISYTNGNIGIGTDPNSSFKLNVAGDIASNGVKISSDIRLKENIKPLEKTIDKISKIQSVSYNYRREAFNDQVKVLSDTSGVLNTINPDYFYNQTRYGFSAQDLQKILPDLVSSDENGFLSIDYIGLIPVLLEAIKEQKQDIDKLKIEIAKLKKSNL